MADNLPALRNAPDRPTAPSSSGGRTPLIPRRILFSHPHRTAPCLSPDGCTLAYLAPHNGSLNIWIIPPGETAGRPLTEHKTGTIRDISWSYDSQSLYFFRDRDGNETWRLYEIRIARGEVRELISIAGAQVRKIAHLNSQPGIMILAVNHPNPARHDVYELDLKSGELTLHTVNPGGVIKWIADNAGVVRAAIAACDDGGYQVLFRASHSAAWKSLLRWNADEIAIVEEDELTCDVLGFTDSGHHLLVKQPGDNGTTELSMIDTGCGSATTVYEDPIFDLGDVLRDLSTGKAQAVCIPGNRKTWKVLDSAVAADFRLLAHALHGDFKIVSRSSADTLWIIREERDTASPAYHRFDRKNARLTPLFTESPDLDAAPLSPVRPISFTSTDGLKIQGYLTLPLESAHSILPTVVFPHGGPWSRDSWRFDAEVQWLANRGYACLQVNFRGSTGFGKQFLNAGDREWGGRMQQDLVDALNWLCDEGISDPDKLAIYGGSYGGYSALVGAAFTPSLFQCAVSYVGVSNLVSFIESIPPHWQNLRANLYQRIGDPATDSEMLRSRSPLFSANKIRIPMLVAHGANDPRIKQVESEQIVREIRMNQVECEYLVFEDEGHGFVQPHNREVFYGAVERFLARHLGGAYEAGQCGELQHRPAMGGKELP